MSNIHTTVPVNSQSARRFRARSCKASKPTEKIVIDLTEDDNNDTTIPCTENQSNDEIVHIDDACDKDESRPDVAKVVKVTSFQVLKADVQELNRGSDMHEFLLCLGSNVLKDITCNGGRALLNTNRKVTTSITEISDLPVDRLKKNTPCDSGWENGHTLEATTTETPHGILRNSLTKDSSIDDGWDLPNQEPCNADGQEKTTSNQNSWSSSGKVENRDTFWGISSQNTPHDDGWGMANEDTCKVTGQEKSTLCQTSWSGANGIENRDMSRDRKRNCLSWTTSEIEGQNGQVSSINDIHGDKMNEVGRRSGKYAPSGSNLVPLGKRKIMVNRPDREDPCDNGWDVINNNTDCIDTWKGVNKGNRVANLTEDSPGQWAGKLENNSLSDDGWCLPSKDLCSDTAQEKFGKKSQSDDGWGMPVEDLRKVTVDDGWGILSDDLEKSTKQDKKTLIQMPWTAANTNESKDVLGQGSELPNADTEIASRNPLDCASSERREQREMSSSVNDSDGGSMNVDRRRSGKYAPSGANLVPLGKRKNTNGPVVRDSCASGWTSNNKETSCTDGGWEVSDKADKVTDLTTESPSWIGRLETDLPCDDGWGLINEDCNPSKESLCGSWGCMLEKESWDGSLWGNAGASEDQHKVNTQETTNLIHSPWSATNDIMNRDKALHTPNQGSEVSDLDPTNMIQNSSDSHNLERKGQNICKSMSDTFGNNTKRKYPENDNDEERRSGRYEPSGANLVPLGKRDSMLNRRYRYLWDQSMCPNEPSEAFNAVKTLASSMRKILHQSRYVVGDKLSPEDQKEVFENALLYHPDKDNKIGCGVDYIMIDTHPEYQSAQCFFIVRNDGSRSDFSYWKCIKGFVQEKYPDHANEVFELLGLL